MTGASPSVGSSSNKRRAPVRKMRPIASICCSPPDNFVPWLEPSRSLRFGKSSKICSRPRPPGFTTGGSNKFSSTLRLAKTPRSSGQKATPARAIWLELRAMSSSPWNRTEPVRCPTIPMMAFSVVVLPAPLRPSSVTTSPSCTSNVTPCRMCDSPYQACRSLTDKSAARASSMADTHISFAHFRILRDGGVVAFGQDSPARQHGDLVAQVLDDAEIMLDHQNGAVGGDALDQRGDAVDVLVTHAGGRLIE